MKVRENEYIRGSYPREGNPFQQQQHHNSFTLTVDCQSIIILQTRNLRYLFNHALQNFLPTFGLCGFLLPNLWAVRSPCRSPRRYLTYRPQAYQYQ